MTNLRDVGPRLVGPFLDALFPRFCLRCGREGALWCGSCVEAYAPARPAAACPFCPAQQGGRTCADCRDQTYLDGLTGVGNYADPILRGAVAHWKYYGDPQAGEAIMRLVRAAAPSLARFSSFTVAWVPLHAARRRERGFDQAEALAHETAKALGGQARGLLRRRLWTSPQARRQARRVGELDGAFAPVGEMPNAVLLCDDVSTSGATIDAAARALKEAGVSFVWGFVLARGNAKTA